MATEHTLRRVARLHALAPYKGKSDDELVIYLEDALSVFLDYTHRSEDPGSSIDSLLCDIAKIGIAKGGAEGVKKAKDGEFEREWSVETGLPLELTARMKMYRQVVGVNATPKLRHPLLLQETPDGNRGRGRGRYSHIHDRRTLQHRVPSGSEVAHPHGAGIHRGYDLPLLHSRRCPRLRSRGHPHGRNR